MPAPSLDEGGDFIGRFQGVLRFLADTHEGQRNNVLYWAACRSRELIQAGLLDENHARAELLRTALGTGLDQRECEGTIESGLNPRGLIQEPTTIEIG